MRTLIALLIPLAWVACAQKRPAADAFDDLAPAPTAPVVQAPVVGGPTAADSLVITLQRTPCFGTCPTFVINVYRSGYATYEGRAHVEREGMFYTHIGADTLSRILADAERSGFYQLNDVYDRDVSDLPSSILRLVGNGKDKRVLARMGTPESFKLLFGRVEELLIPVAWKPLPKVD